MKKLPIILIYSRLLFAIVIITLAILKPQHYSAAIMTLMAAGLLSDIFDGIIARRLNVSTKLLRRLDSAVDQFFWLAIVGCCYMLCPDFFKANATQLIILVGTEALCYLVSYIKFKKEVATHAIASKFWTLILFATLIEIVASCQSPLLFKICFYTGIATRLEIIGMLLIIKSWTNDIPTIYHAVLLRHNKPIKRNKLFNG